MKANRLRFSLTVLVTLLCLETVVRAQFTYTTIDPPGSHYTQPTGVSGNNVVGFYIDGSSVYHGFLYNGGVYTTIDPPGSTGTEVTGVSGNNLTGVYGDSNKVSHGFLYNGGTYTTIDPAGSEGTFSKGVSGTTVVGYYSDINASTHGFLADGGSAATIDVPAGIDTLPNSVSGSNVAGYYLDSNAKPHGFLYDTVTYTTIDPPGTTTTVALAVAGSNVAGYYVDGSSVTHGFLYNSGTYTTLDPPGSTSTEVFGAGGPDLVGYYLDGQSNQHGFLYNGGGFTTLDVPGGDSPTAVGISGSNVVGYYKINFATHGFLVNLGGTASLSGLALSIGTLSPSFAPATFSYTANVPTGASSITITPTAADPTATVQVNGTTVASGAASGPISLAVGSNTITIVVTGSDGVTTQTYTVSVTRAAGIVTAPPGLAPGSVYRLVFVTDGSMAGDSSVISDYNTFVTSEASTSPALAALGTTWTAICSIGYQTVIIAAIDNTYTNGIGYPIYRLDGSLVAANYTSLWSGRIQAGINTSETGVIKESGFVWTGTTTTGSCSNGSENGSSGLSVTYPTVGEPAEKGSNWIDFGAPNFTDFAPLPMYAMSGILTVPYGPTDLSGLALSTGTLTPDFSTVTTSYTVSVPYTTASITVTPTVPIATSTAQVNGTTVGSGTASGPISLAVGSNSIAVVVTAQDGTTTKTYTISVTRAAPSTNATLSSLALSAGTLSPVFSSGTTSYAVTALNTTTSITVTPTVADPTATVQVNGTAVASGAASGAISLAPGPNTITVLVTAQDGTTTDTYTVVATRAVLPAVATLEASGVTATGATFNGTVNANGASTAVSFAYGLKTTYGSTVAATPATATGTSATPVSATVPNLLPATTYHYQVRGTNAAGTVAGADATFTTPNNVTTLSSLKVSAGTLSPVFSSTVSSYAVTVPATTTTITLTPTVTAGSNATVSVKGATVISGSASAPITLSPGVNVIPVVVTAQDGATTKTYTVTVTQSTSPVAVTLAATDLVATGATLNGTVNANGASTKASFVYGLTASYGSTAAAVPATVTGGSPVAVSAKLTGLKPATTYHYQVKGVSTVGTGLGGDAMFTTLAADVLATATTGAATASSATSATFNGTINANNESTAASFDYGTSPAYGSNVAATPSPVLGNTVVPVAATVSTLKPGTLYHYRVKGVNAAGTSPGADLIVKTPSNVATLAGLVLNGGTLSPAFKGATTSYTALVPLATTSVTIKPTVTAGSNATVKVGGNTVASGATSGSITLSLGANPISVVVTAEDGVTTKTYTVVVTQAATPWVTTFAATNVTASAATFNGTVTAHGASTAVSFDYGTSLTYGSNVSATPSPLNGGAATPVSAVVSTLKAGTLYHFRAKGVNAAGTTTGGDLTFTTQSNVATLSALSLSSGTLSPKFASATTSYTASVSNSTTSLTVKPTVSNANATVKVNGSGVASGTASGAVAISAGVNPISVVVTAQNGTTKTYTIAVVQPEAPSVVTGVASSLAATGATLNGTINANGTSTTASFSYGLTASYGNTVAATPATVTGGATTAVSAKLTLLKPSTTYHYQIKGVSSAGTSTGGDAMFTTPATPVLATINTAAATSVGTTTATLNGTAVANNFSTTLSFDYGTSTSYGQNAAATPSTANGTVSTNMSVPLTGLLPGTLYHYRAKGVNAAGTTNGGDLTFTTTSTVATLSALKLSTGTLSPAFSSGTTAYAVTVPNATASLTVTPTVTANSHATVTVNNITVISGSASAPVALNPGANVITVAVTAQDGVTVVKYTLNVTRTTPAPVVVTLGATAVGSVGATLNGTVNAGGTNATASFDYGLTTAYGSTMAATPAPVTGTTAVAVSAAVTGLQPATMYHYRVYASNAGGLSSGLDTIFTTPSNVDTLSNLVLSTGPMDQGFDPATTSYTQTVSSSTTSLTVTPTVTANSQATVTVNGSTVASGSASVSQPLSTGTNTITVVVTAQDGTTTNTYTITVTVPVAGGVAQQASSQPVTPLASGAASVPIKAQLTGPVANGGVLSGATVTLTWNAGRGGSEYWLSVGSTVGGTEFYDGNQALALSHTLILPTDGAEVYVTLQSMINGAWQANNYVFTAADTAVKSVLTSPADESVLPGENVPFTWTPIPGAAAYWLSIGSTANGTDLYDASQELALTQTVTLPTDGRALFVTLKTNLDGQWVESNSTLTAAGSGAPVAAHLTSPAGNSVLSGSPVTFTWDTGTGASEYWLSVGRSTVATDLYNASQGSHQKVTIAMPVDGSPIYITLSSRINGQWQSNQYLFQAAVPP